jgi:hypothetical protein
VNLVANFDWNDRQYTVSVDQGGVLDITSPLLHILGDYADGAILHARYRAGHAQVPIDLLEAAEAALRAVTP